MVKKTNSPSDHSLFESYDDYEKDMIRRGAIHIKGMLPKKGVSLFVLSKQ